jgi:hypothetical protein
MGTLLKLNDFSRIERPADAVQVAPAHLDSRILLAGKIPSIPEIGLPGVSKWLMV